MSTDLPKMLFSSVSELSQRYQHRGRTWLIILIWLKYSHPLIHHSNNSHREFSLRFYLFLLRTIINFVQFDYHITINTCLFTESSHLTHFYIEPTLNSNFCLLCYPFRWIQVGVLNYNNLHRPPKGLVLPPESLKWTQRSILLSTETTPRSTMNTSGATSATVTGRPSNIQSKRATSITQKII